MAPIRFISWKVRGLNDRLIRSLVMAYLKKYIPHVCILQETHLVGSKILSLGGGDMGRTNFHQATYSGCVRGVSIIIHKSLSYNLLDVKIDLEGRYVLLQASVEAEMLILGLYIQPPATISILKYLTPLLSVYPTDNLIIAGDFNDSEPIPRYVVSGC